MAGSSTLCQYKVRVLVDASLLAGEDDGGRAELLDDGGAVEAVTRLQTRSRIDRRVGEAALEVHAAPPGLGSLNASQGTARSRLDDWSSQWSDADDPKVHPFDALVAAFGVRVAVRLLVRSMKPPNGQIGH